MSEYRRDPITGRWVLISANRSKRPNAFTRERVEIPPDPKCPFCPGNEHKTPPEVHSLRWNGSAADTPGWKTRTFSNKYPAFAQFGTLNGNVLDGMFQRHAAEGVHEVIVETPEHGKRLEDRTPAEVRDLLDTYKARLDSIRAEGSATHVQVYRNDGAGAGASIPHPHSQLAAVAGPALSAHPVLSEVRDRALRGDAPRLGTLLEDELRDGRRIIHESDNFVVLSAYAARFAYESWIVPKVPGAHFERTSEALRDEFSQVVLQHHQALGATTNGSSTNSVLQSAPFESGWDDFFRWFWVVFPRLTKMAGFELGSGVHMNTVQPEAAAETLRDNWPSN